MVALSMLIDGPTEVANALTHPSCGVVASVVYTAGLASLVGYVIWNSLLARFPASQVAPFSLLVPPIGVISAWIVLGDRPSIAELIGGVLLLLGVAVTTGVLKTLARGIKNGPRPRRKVVVSQLPKEVSASR
ncbi:EamA family transporter [Brevibacterium sp. JSBI002]|nr:EamA family transporter [Brevibacterium sp. JSBI002]UZD61792.1 EamA family transporter [Brevibacterium sp. JSBI002]